MNDIIVTKTDKSKEYTCILTIDAVADGKALILHDKETLEPLFMIEELYVFNGIDNRITPCSQFINDIDMILEDIQTWPENLTYASCRLAKLRNLKSTGKPQIGNYTLSMLPPKEAKPVTYCWRCTYAKYDEKRQIQGKRYWIGIDEFNSILQLIDCDDPFHTTVINYTNGESPIRNFKGVIINPNSDTALVKVDDRIRIANKNFDVNKAENAPEIRDKNTIDRYMHDVSYLFVAEDFNRIPDEYIFPNIIKYQESKKIIDFEFNRPINRDQAYKYMKERLKCDHIEIKDKTDMVTKKTVWQFQIPSTISLEKLNIIGSVHI